MKTRNLAFIFALCFAFVSCNENKKSDTPEVVTVTPKTEVYTSAKTDAAFKEATTAGVFDAYIKLKTALVNTNSTIASAAGMVLLQKLKEAQADQTTLDSVEALVVSSDVEAQRKEFVTITASVEKMLEGALTSGTVYKQYCPMAFGNTGAYWLSTSKDIQNPYFGDKMLKCGRVADEIK
ncbi:DUF3347 domain-containing protein [Ulvibacter litoralis]|uniref:DUF3347 domain-containing protein n=1 Tax=Ulvibacter litoralis TaxID=227084 RepID=A0A1G7CFY8_9FLAO|nr:DUF3347 domain-containing protein [Ulvibacter litoralis]GHC47790.1 hypothetical protein GCM10008083_08800 [Ulvibacter litoralis]SDE37335.1 Protein of unknown function [Ulvibacter litoralis]